MNYFSRLRQCPVCFARLTWIVWGMEDKWPGSCSYVGCYIYIYIYIYINNIDCNIYRKRALNVADRAYISVFG